MTLHFGDRDGTEEQDDHQGDNVSDLDSVETASTISGRDHAPFYTVNARV